MSEEQTNQFLRGERIAVPDTSALLKNSQLIDELNKEYSKVIIPKVVVDELDRCIPQYAIKVLERLHHIFYGLDNVIVILAIDRRQLEHSVEEMFGINSLEDKRIDVEKYLKNSVSQQTA